MFFVVFVHVLPLEVFFSFRFFFFYSLVLWLKLAVQLIVDFFVARDFVGLLIHASVFCLLCA